MSSSPKMIALMSSDNETFEVSEAVALESQTIKHMIEDDCANTTIPLPNVSGSILSKVIEYCKRHVEAPKSDDASKPDEDLKSFDAEFVKVDQATLFDLILAANYLNIKSLLDLTYTMADALYNKYNKQPEVRSDSKSMYMLVHLIGRPGFALYRINDPLHHLVNDNDASLLNELKPLLVFPCIFDRQPNYFNCIKLESKFYFFGLDHCFGGDIRDKSIFTSVYTIEEEFLTRIKPSEHNDISNYKNLLAQTKNPMHARKYFPALFVANHKLYALSRHCFDGSMFEVFDPSEQTWQVLPCPYLKPRTYDAPLLLLEQENIVYFSSGDAIPTFNLNTHTWTNYTSLDDDYYFYDDDDDDDDETPNPPLFNQNRVSIINDLAFGFRIDANTYNYVCASSSRGKELMQPNLAPNQAFLDVLRSSRFTYLQEQYDLYFDYIVALQDLDGKQVMCIVTYGTSPSEEIGHNAYYYKTSYVALSFFDVPGDFYTSKDSPPREYHSDKSYADEKAEDGCMVTRFFNAKFRHTSHFVINNSNNPTHGELVTCFF